MGRAGRARVAGVAVDDASEIGRFQEVVVNSGRLPGSGVGLRSPVLVLNKSYQPVRIPDAKQGFSMLFHGRARAPAPRHR